MSTPVKGRCFCGKVEFALTPPTDFVGHCHCQSCRLSHASAFVTWTSVPKDRFRFLKGEGEITWYTSSEFIQWGFCKNCGSSALYQANKEGHPDNPKTDRMYVSVGCLIDELDRSPGAHVSFEEKVSWLDVKDSLDKFRGKGEEKIN